MRLIALALIVVFQDKQPAPPPPTPDTQTTTEHKISVGGDAISYTATAGTMTIKNDADKPQAKIFYIAYTKKDADPAKRPLTFAFNGGPGSSSVWLHLGLLGPKRVDVKDDAPPYALVENASTLLDKTDLVFIDPVWTGYSRPVEGVEAKNFFGVEEDLESVGRFIHLFVTKNNRWGSPRFLVGESYGTTRAAGLSSYLQDTFGMELNGIVLVSCVLDFNTISQSSDLSFTLFLPTYTATAWYHKKLEPELQKDFAKTIRESEEFAAGEYASALFKGSDLPDDERKKVVAKIARLTGVSETFVDQCNLRMPQGRFSKELRRAERLSVGRYDSRFAGADPDPASDRGGYDPSYTAVQGPFTECLYKYLRKDLEYQSDLVYEVLSGKVRPWNYGQAGNNRYLDVSGRLRNAMIHNPHLKVFVACGYYDQATPFFAAHYTFSHMGLQPEQRKNVTFGHYEAGHMMYVHAPSLTRLREDLGKFMDGALSR